MRVLISAAVAILVLAAGTMITAQTKRGQVDKEKRDDTQPSEKEAAKTNPTAERAARSNRAIVARLQAELPTGPFEDPIKLKDFLQEVHDTLLKQNKDVVFAVDEQAFRDEYPDIAENPLDVEVRIKGFRNRATAIDLLRQAVKQMPKHAAFVIRAGKVEIVPAARTAKEHMLNQTFHVDFKDMRLDQAIEELSELTGVSIVLDARARQKAQTTVTARFNDDVALQDAVRMLTDMSELKLVYLVTGLYVTTPEHAPVMQKELQRIYEPWTLTPAMPTVPMGPGDLPMSPGMMFDPLNPPGSSPLAPPLPPQRGRRADAAV